MGDNQDETVSNGKLLETSPFAGDLENELAARPRRRFPRSRWFSQPGCCSSPG